jgi:phage shock protein A
MTAEDWKNRCDSYRDLSTRLHAKLDVVKELNESLQLRIKELEGKIEKMRELIFYVHDQSTSLSLKYKIMEALK